MVAQPVTIPVADIAVDNAAENAVVLWAVFNALDAVPATPETQLVSEEARRRLRQKIASAGIPTADIDEALASYPFPRLEFPEEEPPPLSC